MKSRLLVTLTCLLAGWMGLAAQEIGVDEARQVAERFAARAVPGGMMRAPGTSAALSLAHTGRGADGVGNAYYVFNRGAGDGFIVVAGDVRAEDVLGYADSGSFVYDSLPPAMRWWLGEYGREIASLPEAAAGTDDGGGRARVAPAGEVAPLLEGIAWNQSWPYNNQCPMYDNDNRCVTGCAATAMAQLMYYHRWPAVGTGSHSYACQVNGREVSLSADFGSTAYAWDEMLPSYDGDETAVQQDAVATLMSHCGVALEMRYGMSSSAYATDIPAALHEYFGYDGGMSYKRRAYYSIDEWERIIREELDNGRPLEYDGQSAGGGHSFVCDGYDGEGYFHFNWGWGGMSNGYFRLSALEPGSLGIGGGSGGGYNYSQAIVVGIRPDAGTPVTDNHELYSDTCFVFDRETAARGEAVVVATNRTYNYGWSPLTVQLAYVLYDAAGEEVWELALMDEPYELDPLYGWNSISFDLALPGDLPDGSYKMFLCGKMNGGSEWEKVRVNKAYPQYAVITYDGDVVTYGLEQDTAPDLDLAAITADSRVYQGRAAQFTATLSNSGGEYYGDVHFVLSDAELNAYLYSAAYSVNVPAGGETVVTFTENIDVAPGDYYMALADAEGYVIGDLVPVEVQPAPSRASSLEVVEQVSFPDNSNVPLDDMRLTVKVRNDGGYFAGEILAYIWDAEENYVMSLAPAMAFIDQGETVELELYGEMPTGEVGGEYILQVFNAYDDQYLMPYENITLNFTLGAPHRETTVGIGGEAVRTAVWPNPATDRVTVESVQPLRGVRVYSLSGALVIDTPCGGETSLGIDVSALKPGAYVLQMMTDNGSETVKLMKR